MPSSASNQKGAPSETATQVTSIPRSRSNQNSVRKYVDQLFGVKLMVRFIVQAAGDAPMVKGVLRLRQAKSLAYLKQLPPKEREREYGLLAAAFTASIAEDGEASYPSAATMFRLLDKVLNR